MSCVKAMAVQKNKQSLTAFVLVLVSMVVFFLPQVQSDSIHDLLRSKGLPAGLFPKAVKSFTLQENGHLEVILDGPCMAKFENRVYFKSVVKGNLSYGELSGLEGLCQEELFIWLPIKEIVVENPLSGVILFDIGVAQKQLSLSLFDEPPDCEPKKNRQETLSLSSDVSGKKNGRNQKGFEAQR